VIVGLEHADDAGVYRITPDIAIIQTVDFFTPIVDDPYWFGQIAAANALSDVYAMGGVPKTAMNLVAFPIKTMDLSILRHILQGGLDKMKEAQVVLVGGHSVEDRELKYGLAVTGLVHPNAVITKRGLAPGDHLVLTKPLGTGIVNTAIKGGIVSGPVVHEVTRLMAALNRDAATIMKQFPVTACTDITGFGLLGHLAEMVEGTGLTVTLHVNKIPLIPHALEYAAMGLVPAGTYKNREFRAPLVEFGADVGPILQDLCFDPQTSGGLLIGVAKKHARHLADRLREGGIAEATVIGEVAEGDRERIVVV